MDELSTEDARSDASVANLRRAFGDPVEGELPPAFADLLGRLSKVSPPSPQRRPGGPYRLGA